VATLCTIAAVVAWEVLGWFEKRVCVVKHTSSEILFVVSRCAPGPGTGIS
jgi:hypothetical protein